MTDGSFPHGSMFAKFWERGVSFAGARSALTYLVDEGGARSITSAFHDLYAKSIANGETNHN